MVIKQPCSLRLGLEWILLSLSWKEFSFVSTLKPEFQLAGRRPRGSSWGSKASETPALLNLLEKTAYQKGSQRLPRVQQPADRDRAWLPTKRSNSLRCWKWFFLRVPRDWWTLGPRWPQAGTDELVPRKRDMCLAKAGGARVKTAWMVSPKGGSRPSLPAPDPETGDCPRIKLTFTTSQLPTWPYCSHPWTKLSLISVNRGQILQSYSSWNNFFFQLWAWSGGCPSFRRCPLRVNPLFHRSTPFRRASEEAFT